MSSIRTDDRPTADVLMEALEQVEGARRVAILMEYDDSFMVKTNGTLQELSFILRQAEHCVMKDLFEPDDKDEAN